MQAVRDDVVCLASFVPDLADRHVIALSRPSSMPPSARKRKGAGRNLREVFVSEYMRSPQLSPPTSKKRVLQRQHRAAAENHERRHRRRCCGRYEPLP
jgi:hypothetical protein